MRFVQNRGVIDSKRGWGRSGMTRAALGLLAMASATAAGCADVQPGEQTVASAAEGSPTTVTDQRFRTYGPSNIKGYDFPYRNGGSSAESCEAGTCDGDFIAVGQLDDRQWGPYAGKDTGTIFKRWFFLRNDRPRHFDCSIGLDFSVTNWVSTSRCIDQMGSDKYEELVRNILGVSGGQEYKTDVLNQQLAAEIPHLPAVIRSFVKARGTSTPIVFEIGNEPNVFPAMPAGMFANYYTRWVNEIRKAAAAVSTELGTQLTIKTMPGGLWMAEGEPTYMRSVLDQGVALAFGRITVSVPTSVGVCGHWYAPYPCVKFKSVDLTSGVDLKGRFYTDTGAYLQQFFAAVPAGYIDYGNLHFYPYLGPDAAFGQGQMAPHISTLRSLAATYATKTNSGEVWLTELGNFNPFDEGTTISTMMTPALTSLKGNEIPQITRWYWFQNQGEDKKFSMLPKGSNTTTMVLALVLGDGLIKGLDALMGPLFTVVRPVTDSTTVAKIGTVVGKFMNNPPLQGLRAQDGTLRAMGNVYYNFAMAPVAGGACGGTSGQWNGCRGNGCAVCSDLVAAYPNYFRNHPQCASNGTCGGQYYQCNAACPQPDDTDR